MVTGNENKQHHNVCITVNYYVLNQDARYSLMSRQAATASVPTQKANQVNKKCLHPCARVWRLLHAQRNPQSTHEAPPKHPRSTLKHP